MYKLRTVRGTPGLRALAVALSIVLGACTRTTRIEPTNSYQDSDPVIVVWRYPAYPLPGKPMVSGLEFAAWADGAILIAAEGRLHPGEQLLVGSANPDDIRNAIARIYDSGFMKGGDNSLVVDAASTTIFVANGSKSATVARTETLQPGVGEDLSNNEDARAFVRTWRQARGAIESIAPIELKRLGDSESFRGYDSRNPVNTAWRPRL